MEHSLHMTLPHTVHAVVSHQVATQLHWPGMQVWQQQKPMHFTWLTQSKVGSIYLYKHTLAIDSLGHDSVTYRVLSFSARELEISQRIRWYKLESRARFCTLVFWKVRIYCMIKDHRLNPGSCSFSVLCLSRRIAAMRSRLTASRVGRKPMLGSFMELRFRRYIWDGYQKSIDPKSRLTHQKATGMWYLSVETWGGEDATCRR